MKVSLKWLNQFVKIDDLSVQEIMDRVVKAGFEVEEVTELSSGTNLVVGKVLECRDHPDSDHLQIGRASCRERV